MRPRSVSASFMLLFCYIFLLVCIVMVILSGVVSPCRSVRTKYCSLVRGGYTAASFGDYRLPPSVVVALVNASNHSLAMSTWASYRTAENHLQRCEHDTGVRMRFPMSNRSSSEWLYFSLFCVFYTIGL